MSLNHLATRFTCSWPWTALVLTCDGRVVGGCADPYAERPLGDARIQRIGEIWTGATVRSVRVADDEGAAPGEVGGWIRRSQKQAGLPAKISGAPWPWRRRISW
jgi:hypothetical protein